MNRTYPASEPVGRSATPVNTSPVRPRQLARTGTQFITPTRLADSIAGLGLSPRRQQALGTPARGRALPAVSGRRQSSYINASSSSSSSSSNDEGDAEGLTDVQKQQRANERVLAAAARVDQVIAELARECRDKARAYPERPHKLHLYMAEDLATYPFLALHVAQDMASNAVRESETTVDSAFVIATAARNYLAAQLLVPITAMIDLLERSCDYATQFFASAPGVAPLQPIDPDRLLVSRNVSRAVGRNSAASDAHAIMMSIFAHRIAAPHAVGFTRRKEHLMRSTLYINAPIPRIVNSYDLSLEDFWAWTARRHV